MCNFSNSIVRLFPLFSLLLISCLSIAQVIDNVDINTGKTPWVKTDHSDQDWFLSVNEDNPNYFEIKSQYDAYFLNHPLEKSMQRQMVRRWLSIYHDYADDKGDVQIIQPTREDYEKIEKASKKALATYQRQKNKYAITRSGSTPPNETWNDSVGTWRMIGPYHSRKDINTLAMYGGFNDRVYINPHNPDNMFAGQSYGGLWVTQDGAETWKLTDAEYPNGKNGYANRDIYYGTINAHPLDANQIVAGSEAGMLISTDAGDNWELANTMNTMDTPGTRAYYVTQDPTDLATMLCTYGKRLYKSTDTGDTWTEIFDNTGGGSNYNQGQHNTIGIFQRGYNFFGLAYHPSDGDIIYLGARNSSNEACVYRSTDGGDSFSLFINSGKTNRVKLITSLADGEHIYIADLYISVNSPAADQGIYKYDTTGVLDQFIAHQGSQGSLLDDINVDANDADHWYYGGYGNGEVWFTENQGDTWTTNNPGYVDHSNYVHADVRSFSIVGDTALIGTDGGLHITRDGGLTYESAGDWISGIDQWGFSSAYKGEVLASGDDHGPTETRTCDADRSWAGIGGADSGEVQVNRCNTDFMYGRDIYSRFLGKRISDSSYVRLSNQVLDAKYEYLQQDPQEYFKFYPIKGTDLSISEDNMSTATLLKSFPTNLTKVVVAMDDNQIMYVLENNKVVNKTTDGGASWSIITPSTTVTNNRTNITDITIDESGDHVWLSYGQTQTNCKAVHSADSGSTWSNITGSALPNFAAGDITYQRGTNGMVYLATNGGGIWYRELADTDWNMLGSGLPSMGYVRTIYTVPDMNKFRMGSARGSFEHDLPVESEVMAYFSVGNRQVTNCVFDTVKFYDYSSYFDDGTISFLWEFEGAETPTSTEMNPIVVYSETGTFDVTLTVTRGNGETSTKTIEDFMTVELADCEVSTLPTLASYNLNGNSYVEVPPPGMENTTDFTWMAWVKGEGQQRAYAGILSQITSNGSIHLNVRDSEVDSTQIGYHHPNGFWWWSSGHYLKPDEWTHLAMVTDATGITIYKNGVPSKHNRTVQPADFDVRFIISSMTSNTGARAFKGDIDEVAVYSRALTTDEIRLARHLTKKNPQHPVLADDDLVAYYQFNTEGDEVYDYSGNNKHGVLFGSIIKRESDGPYGGGVSESQDISASGTFDYATPGVQLEFGTTVPDGEVVVSHIENLPNLSPTDGVMHEQGYYIINNYGSNQSFDPLSSISFTKTGTISDQVALDNNDFKIYKRPSNSHFLEYELVVDAPDISLAAGAKGTVNGDDATAITSFSQFAITRAEYPESLPDISFVPPAQQGLPVVGGESMSFHFDSENQGLLLPVLSDAEIDALGAPVDGMLTYSSSLKKLIIHLNGEWLIIGSDLLLSVENDGAVQGDSYIQFSSGTQIDSSAIYAMQEQGFVKFLSTSNADLTEIKYPVEGMIIFNTDEAQLQYFNGSNWTNFLREPSGLVTATSAATYVEGVHNGVAKEDNAILQDNDTDGAIMIPTLSANDILRPVEGLIVYDTDRKAFLFYNGDSWNRVKDK